MPAMIKERRTEAHPEKPSTHPCVATGTHLVAITQSHLGELLLGSAAARGVKGY